MTLKFVDPNSSSIPEISVNTFLGRCLLLPKGFMYRGQGDKGWDLVPAAFRDGAGSTIPLADRGRRIKYFADESQIDADFGRMAALAMPGENVVIPKESGYRTLLMLAFFQHFGIPTPLLDWTSSPLIALFMALFERPRTTANVSIYRLDPTLLPADATFQQYDKLLVFRRIQQQLGGVFFFGTCDEKKINMFPTIYREYTTTTTHPRFIEKLDIKIGPGDIDRIHDALRNNGFREDIIFPNSIQYVSQQIRERILQL
jgi:hypothetical protein